MDARFDPTENAANLARHGVSLAFGESLFDDADHLIMPTIREQDREHRFKVVGMVEGRLFTGVFVWRNDLPRFHLGQEEQRW